MLLDQKQCGTHDSVVIHEGSSYLRMCNCKDLTIVRYRCSARASGYCYSCTTYVNKVNTVNIIYRNEDESTVDCRHAVNLAVRTVPAGNISTLLLVPYRRVALSVSHVAVGADGAQTCTE